MRREDIPAILPLPVGKRQFTAVLPPDTAEQVPETAKMAVLAAAYRLMKGEREVLGVVRTDLMMPGWFCDPVTGRRLPPDRYALRINHRAEEQSGNVKNMWEISRLQHLTLPATAWFVTGDEEYARRVADQLRSWWRENPFLWLDRASRTVDVVDEIDGGSHDLRLAFHLGPDVQTELTGSDALLCWPGASTPGTARLELPRRLQWSLRRGETDPILGWYSCGLGRFTPACTLIGRGRSAPHAAFATHLHFPDRRPGQVPLAKGSGTEVPAMPSTNT